MGRHVALAVQESAPSSGEHTEVSSLLDAYDRALAVAADPPPSLRLPARLRPVHLALRPRLGTRMWAEREVRRNIDALDRGLARELAVAPAGGDRDAASARERLRHFRESLPATGSRIASAAILVAFLLLVQVLLDVLPGFIEERVDDHQLKDALAEIDPSLSAGSARDLMDAAVHSTQVPLFLFMTAVSWAAYVVLRLPAGGYRLATLALGRDTGRRARRRDSELVGARQSDGLREQQARVFSRHGVVAPAPFPIDLGVKAAFWVPLLLVATESFRFWLQSPQGSTSDFTSAIISIAFVLARYTLLTRTGRRRGERMTWLWLGAAIVAVVGLATQLDPAYR